MTYESPTDEDDRARVAFSGPWLEVQTEDEIETLCHAFQGFADGHAAPDAPDVRYNFDEEKLTIVADFDSRSDYQQFVNAVVHFKHKKMTSDEIMERLDDRGDTAQ